MIDARELLARQAEPFRSLRACRDENRLEAERAQIVQREIALRADRHVAVIVNIWVVEYAAKLLAESIFHGVFGGVDAVLGQSARFDVAVEQDDARACVGKFARAEKSGRACAHDGGEVLVLHDFTSSFEKSFDQNALIIIRNPLAADANGL